MKSDAPTYTRQSGHGGSPWWRRTAATFVSSWLRFRYTPGRSLGTLLRRGRRGLAGVFKFACHAPSRWAKQARNKRRPRKNTAPPRQQKVEQRPTFVYSAPSEPDYYAILGLAPGSSADQVRAQYRRLAKKHHPDLRGNGSFWQEHFKKINAARDFLSDPARKAAYDQRREANKALR